MEDLKTRWSVTYTKHLKQKRKVYQDGFLDLHVSENKVKLYDECDKLLECRILKKDEVISSGETLTFNAHIVDVGNPEGDPKPCHDSSCHVRDKKTAETHGLKHGYKFTSSSTDSGARTINSKNNIARKPRPNNTSPSQKLIREFRKSELQKYGTAQSSPRKPKHSIEEWHVLYTTQITQKAKKYHDGFLQLESCGSLGRQIMLYDATRKLLDSRFLKKDEIIRSGESISYNTHLVDIGEPEEDSDPLEDLVMRGSKGNILAKREAMLGQQNYAERNDSLGGVEFKKTECKYGAAQSSSDAVSTISEWQAMYTTQTTQKAKTYHDGFLQLKTCGSMGRQVMIYDASRKLLNSRFLKKDEMIKSGESISFEAHLVDIGDPLMDLNDQGTNYDIVSQPGAMYRKQDCLEADKKGAKGSHERKPQMRASSGEEAGSHSNINTLDKIKLSKNLSTNKPLRDACQILSVLQRPRALNVVPGCIDIRVTGPVLKSTDSQESANVDSPEDSQPSKVSVPCNEPSEIIDFGKAGENNDIEDYKDLMNGGGSGHMGNQFSKDTETGRLNQSNPNIVETESEWQDKDSASGTSSAFAYTSSPNDESRNPEEVKNATELSDCPRFDLGF